MSHEITVTNGTAEMAFVGQTPWHGLGQRMERGAPIIKWGESAGMLWSAKRAMVQYDIGHTFGTWPDREVLYRSDNGAPLGIVSDTYKIVQPMEVLEFFRDLTEAGGWHIHTAGTLQGGRKLWALASNHTEAEIVRGDRVRGNLLLSTSMDGTAKTTAAMTAIRVVCANTLRLAFSNLGADAVEVSHRSHFDPDAAKEQLGVARESFDKFVIDARTLADKGCSLDQARDILRRIFGQPRIVKPQNEEPVAVAKGTIDGSELAQLLARPAVLTEDRAQRAIEQRTVTKVLELFSGAGRGADHQGVAGTRWGLLNAVTEHVDHSMGRTQDARLAAAWFGRGQAIKSEALQTLLLA